MFIIIHNTMGYGHICHSNCVHKAIGHVLMKKNVAGLNLSSSKCYFSNQDTQELIISFIFLSHSSDFQIIQITNATYLLMHLLWRMRH